jgi:hypothetical protein
LLVALLAGDIPPTLPVRQCLDSFGGVTGVLDSQLIMKDL